jgi:hypothetical protein
MHYLIIFFFQTLFSFIGYCKDDLNIIHVFGDSHASFSYSEDKIFLPKSEFFEYSSQFKKIKFKIHHLGPKTIWGFSKNYFDLGRYRVQRDDVVVFCLGEIDIRCHILRQADLQKKTIEEIYSLVLNKYLNAISKSLRKTKPLLCVIQSIIPPTNNVTLPHSLIHS